jgi:hypothetical protein
MDPSSPISRHVIQRMTVTNGIPGSYVANLLSPNRSYMISGSADISKSGLPFVEDLVSTFDWYAIPKALSDELAKLPWEMIMGQGVLIHDIRDNTALLSIAEAASLQQHYFAELLERLLYAMETGRLASNGSVGPIVIFLSSSQVRTSSLNRDRNNSHN